MAGDVLTADHLVVGAAGSVAGVVNATVVIVRGTVTGNIVAAERVELAAAARVIGDIETPVLAMESGAVLEGHCRIVRMRDNAQPVGVVLPLVR